MLGTNQCSRGGFNRIDLVGPRGQAQHKAFVVRLWRRNIDLYASSVSMVDVLGALHSRHANGPPLSACGNSALQQPFVGGILTKSKLLRGLCGFAVRAGFALVPEATQVSADHVKGAA